MERIKGVIIGDVGVGKTSLLEVLYCGKVQESRRTYQVESFLFNLGDKDTNCDLTIWDTRCQEDYNRLRPLGYPGTDIFLIMFALNDPPSLEHVITKWVPELDQYSWLYSKKTRILLVGGKLDLVQQKREKFKRLIKKEVLEEFEKEFNQSYKKGYFPIEIIIFILSFVDAITLLRSERVSKLWRGFKENEDLWKNKSRKKPLFFQDCIMEGKGRKVANLIKAEDYLECSLDLTNLTLVLELTVKIALKSRSSSNRIKSEETSPLPFPSNKKCSLM